MSHVRHTRCLRWRLAPSTPIAPFRPHGPGAVAQRPGAERVLWSTFSRGCFPCFGRPSVYEATRIHSAPRRAVQARRRAALTRSCGRGTSQAASGAPAALPSPRRARGPRPRLRPRRPPPLAGRPRAPGRRGARRRARGRPSSPPRSAPGSTPPLRPPRPRPRVSRGQRGGGAGGLGRGGAGVGRACEAGGEDGEEEERALEDVEQLVESKHKDHARDQQRRLC